MARFRVSICVRRIKSVLHPEAIAIEKVLRNPMGAFCYKNIEECTFSVSRLFEFILSAKSECEAHSIAEKMCSDNFLANGQIEKATIMSIEKLKRKGARKRSA